MRLYTLDPLLDNRWDDLVAHHPRASVFHRNGWLRTLTKTYGYPAMVVTTSPPGEPLSDGVVLCEVRSWITGSRLVSLPFSDHAEPLLNESCGNPEIVEWMRGECRRSDWRYIEFRPLSGDFRATDCMRVSESFWFHSLDLSPSTGRLFRNCHRNCIQRRVRHAERQGLSYQRGCSAELLDAFYELLIITRKRHRLLPQPRAWFRNLLECMAPDAEIRLVRKDGIPLAAILTLRHRNTVVYKYGCSDGKLHHFAGPPLLFWRLIEESKAEGAEQIDFGRTDLDNAGLARFKDRLGALRTQISYFRCTMDDRENFASVSDLPKTSALCSTLPAVLSSMAGQLMYRHMG
jgi:CelD/BcsL family acetyltransferase involved in cellulose biosynthesis